MKKGSNKLVVVFLVIGMLLTGCGGGDADTAAPAYQGQREEEKLEYMEQALKLEDMKEDGVQFNSMSLVTSMEGKVYQVLQSEKGIPYLAEQEGDEWKICPCPWEKEWKKKFGGDEFQTAEYHVLDEKTWYVQVYEQSMASNRELYEKDPEKYWEEYYTVHGYLMRIDRESGKMEEIPTPQTTAKEIYQELGESLPESVNGKEVCWAQIKFFPDGNFYLSDGGIDKGIYNGITGEQIVELDIKNSDMIYCAIGNGFLASIGKDEGTGKYLLHVFNELTGVEEYSVELEMEEKENEYGVQAVNVALGALDHTIVMVYDRCIYTMDYGDEQFQKVIDAEESTMFYLPDEEYVYETVYMGEQEDFYLGLYKESDTDRICHYRKKGTENNEE